MKLLDDQVIGELLLAELYQQFINDDIGYEESIAVDELIEKCAQVVAPGYKLGRNASRVAIDELEDKNLVKHDDDQLAPSIRITSAGVRRTRALIADKNSSASNYLRERERLHGAGESGTEQTDSSQPEEAIAPSAPDEWAPLKIDRGTPSYQQAVDALQAAYEAIRQDNGFAASEPDVRDSIVGNLESGIDELKNKAPTKETLRVLVFSPLSYMARRFADAILGESAKVALRALSNWAKSMGLDLF